MPKAAQKITTLPAKRFHHVCANNAEIRVEGDTLTITVDLKRNCGLSSTGKTLTVGSTNGFLQIPTHEGTVVSLNVNRKA